MASESEQSAREASRDAIYLKISEAVSAMDVKSPRDSVVASPAIADLARAWRYLSGGQQPGGGCNCSGK